MSQPTAKLSDVRTVIEHYRRYHPQYRVLSTSKGYLKVRMRLEEGYTVDELCQAIDGCHGSPFHCGVNADGRKYQSLELICRNADKVHQFIELAKQVNAPHATRQTRRNVAAAASWAERKQRKGGA